MKRGYQLSVASGFLGVDTRSLTLGTGLALALPLLGGCQALDKPTGANRDGYDVRVKIEETSRGPVQRPAGVPAPIATEEQGRLLLAQGLTDQALQAFEKAIGENPLSETAYLKAGDIYRDRGDFSSAQKRYEAAAVAKPDNFEAQYKNGLMLHLLNRVGEAVGAYLRALQINPNDPNANFNAGTAFLQLGNPQQAVTYAERAVELDRRNPKARANLGAVYAELNRHAEAVAQYREAAQLEELSPPLLLNLANSLGKLQQYGEMLNTLDALLRTDPTPIAHERRAYALFKTNRFEESLAACKSALSLDENHFPAWNILGVIHINAWRQGGMDTDLDRQEALKCWRKSLSISPNQAYVQNLITTYQ